MRRKEARENANNQLITEFEELTERLDKIRMVLIYPELLALLNHTETAYFKKLQKAFALTYMMKIEAEAVAYISNHIEEAERTAYAKQIFEDMHDVYGSFMDTNKALENKLYAERQKRYAAKARDLAESSQDYDYTSKIEERAAKAGGYDTPVDEDVDDAPPPKLIFVTSDMGILEAQKRGLPPAIGMLYARPEAEDIEVETDEEGDNECD
jgi:hypothetical protein